MGVSDTLCLADGDTANDLIGYLRRLLRYDRAAVVRLIAADQIVAVWGHPPFGVYTVRTGRLAADGGARRCDATLSAGQLLDAIDADTGRCGLPAAVTGPGWAGLVPPRAGWAHVGVLRALDVAEAVEAATREFRVASNRLGEASRDELERLATRIWDRPLAGEAGPRLRAAHAAVSLGFLGDRRSIAPAATVAVAERSPWLRLDARYGSVVSRSAHAATAGPLILR